MTAEEITALRRVERKGAKLAKKLERDAEKLVAASAAATASSSSAASAPSGSAPGTPTTATATVTLEAGEPTDGRDEDGAGGERTESTTADKKGKGKADGDADRGASVEADEATEETQEAPPEEWQLDAEHSQLQPEEAFFLSFALGTLALIRPDPSPIPSSSDPAPSRDAARRLSILESFRLFLESAAAAATTAAVPRSPPTALLDPRLNRLDSPFLLSYAAYHHFRSMGWVARSGTKFCVDWVLYGQGGPVGGHAEYVTRGLHREFSVQQLTE